MKRQSLFNSTNHLSRRGAQCARHSNHDAEIRTHTVRSCEDVLPLNQAIFLLWKRVLCLFYQNRFTERARQALTLAQEAAASFGHSYIGSEHLLLGLLREGGGPAAKALTAAGVTDEALVQYRSKSCPAAAPRIPPRRRA